MSTTPGVVEITQYTCESDADGTNSGCTLSACGNPLYAYDNQDECGAVTLVSLSLSPSSVSVGVDRQALVRVIAEFSTGQTADVTEESTIVPGSDLIVEHTGSGVLKGLLVGSTSLKGVWRGRIAEGDVTVFDTSCQVDYDWDVVFVLDESVGSYLYRNSVPTRSTTGGIFGANWRKESPTGLAPVIDDYGDFVLAMQLSMDLLNPWNEDLTGNDRVAVVLSGNGVPTVPVGWTNSVQVVSTSARYSTTTAGYLTTIQSESALGKALQKAQTLLTTARADARKVVVILTHGAETDCSPPARAITNVLQNSGYEVVVVTPVTPGVAAYSTCSYPLSVYTHLQAMASPCLFYDGANSGTARNVLSQILANACAGCDYSGSGLGIGLF